LLLRQQKNNNSKKTKSNLCQYAINSCFSMALQLMGVGGTHAGTLVALLDLPDAVKWNRQFRILEDFTYDSIENVKYYSQMKSVEEEIL
jgi:hypothetical protein